MTFTKFLAGASLALTLSAMTPIAMAQTGGGMGGATGNSGNMGGGGAAETAPGAENTQNAQQMATRVANDISKAKSEGKNVHQAQAQHRMGELALKRGQEKTAMRHFQAAERELGMAQNNSGAGSGPGAMAPEGAAPGGAPGGTTP